MSAALNPSRRPRSPRKSSAHGAPSTTAPLGRVARFPKQRSTVQKLPSQGTTPQWLRSLLLMQRISVAFTFVLAGSALTVYGWTVYAQQLWSKEYQKLDQLRREERQLTTSKEVLNDKIAKQADRPGTTLAPQRPDSMIFLPPAPARPEAEATAATPQASPTTPLGY